MRLHRVDAQPLGGQVQVGLGRELGLERTERTHRTGRRVVGVDADGVDPHVGYGVGPRPQDRRLVHDAGRGHRVGAAVGDHHHLRRDDPAVALQAHRVADPERMALGRGDALSSRVNT